VVLKRGKGTRVTTSDIYSAAGPGGKQDSRPPFLEAKENEAREQVLTGAMLGGVSRGSLNTASGTN